MELAAILALVQGAIAAANGLADLASRLENGQQPTPEDFALLKKERAAELARSDAALGDTLG